MGARRALGTWLGLFVLFGGLVLACAGSFSPIPPADADAEASTPVVPSSSGSAPDAGPPSPAEASVDAGACNVLEPRAGALVPRSVAGPPPAAKGGALVDGTYDMTAVNVYRNETSPFAVASVIEMQGSAFRMTTRLLNASSRLAGTYTRAGSRIAIRTSCSDGLAIVADSFDYTSEQGGAVLELYGSFENRDFEYVFTKR